MVRVSPFPKGNHIGNITDKSYSRNTQIDINYIFVCIHISEWNTYGAQKQVIYI